MSRKTPIMLAIVLGLCLSGCKGNSKLETANSEISNSIANSIVDASQSSVWSDVEIGNYITFGSYEQNYIANGKDAIEWMVLDKQDDKILVISRYGLDCQPYNTEEEKVTWETCTLRNWLNSSFYDVAFTPEEKRAILTSKVTAEPNPEYDTPPGNDTMDKVFLLSVNEAIRYFDDDVARRCQRTAYCYAQGALDIGTSGCAWWLRSPGKYSNSAASVIHFGEVGNFGYDVYRGDYAVRPALWIKLNP